MYEDFFGLKEKPFSIQPDPSFLYWGRTHRLAYAMLEYGVLNQAGISIVTGEVGCGKTTLIHRLLDQLSESHTVSLLSNIQRDRGDLLSWVLMGFGQPFSNMDHVEKFAALQRFFIAEYGRGRRVVLIIDEAQNLSIDMLEEIRMLSNINAGKHQLLQLILIGQPQLKQLLNRPDMLQLAQRVGADFHLTPLNRDEVHAYIDTRLAIAGATRPIFTEKAIDLVARESRGVPRVINIIADTALVYGFSAGGAVVEEDSIRAVIADKGSYGVFGIASDSDLQLSEETGVGPTSFISETGPAGDGSASSQRRAPPRAYHASQAAVMDVRAATHPTTLFPDLEAPVGFVAGFEPARALFDADGEGAEPAPSRAVAATTMAPPVVAPVASPRPQAAAPHASNMTQASTIPSSQASAVATSAPPASGVRPQQRAGSSVDDRRSTVGVIVYGENAEAIASALVGADEQIVKVLLVRTGEGAAPQRPLDGIDVVELGVGSASPGRARNAGYRRLKKVAPEIHYVQFVGPNARLEPEWVSHAASFMSRRPEVAAVSGAEAPAPDTRNMFVAMKSISLDRPAGETTTTSESFMVRASAFEAAGGFRGDIPGAETADLCVRLRRRGAHIWRLEEQMTTISPPLKGVGGWLASAQRDGRAYALRAALHGSPPERLCAVERSRAIIWGCVFPLFVLIASGAAAAGAYALGLSVPPVLAAAIVVALGVAVYLAKVVAIALRVGPFRLRGWQYGIFVTLGHFAEFVGLLRAGRAIRELRRARRR